MFLAKSFLMNKRDWNRNLINNVLIKPKFTSKTNRVGNLHPLIQQSLDCSTIVMLSGSILKKISWLNFFTLILAELSLREIIAIAKWIVFSFMDLKTEWFMSTSKCLILRWGAISCSFWAEFIYIQMRLTESLIVVFLSVTLFIIVQPFVAWCILFALKIKQPFV